MIRYTRHLVLLLAVFLVSCAGGGALLPEDELRLKTAEEIIKLGGDRYVSYDMNGALKYYHRVLEWHTNDREATAWANYEIGFILYQQGREKEALEYFETVLVSDSPNPAPQILAAKVKDVINSRPPVLDVTAEFDLGTNSVLTADSKGLITLRLFNRGRGLVNRIRLEVDENRSTQGIYFNLPPAVTMPVGSSNILILPFTTDKSLESGNSRVVINLADPRFTQNPRIVKIRIPKQGLPKPQLSISHWDIVDGGQEPLRGNTNQVVNSGETVELRLWVTNKGQGVAYEVGGEVEGIGSELVEILSPVSLVELGTILPGETRQMSIVFSVPEAYRMKRNAPKQGAFRVKLLEDREFGQSSPIIRFPIIKLPIPVLQTNSTNTP